MPAKGYRKERLEKKCDKCLISFFVLPAHAIKRFCSVKCSQLGHTRKIINFWQRASVAEKIEKLKELFNRAVIKNEGCWLWKKVPLSNGYGSVYFGKGKHITSHRASWSIHKGIIPEGMQVLHKCDNKICTNPDHLFLGTATDNFWDMYNKGRYNITRRS